MSIVEFLLLLYTKYKILYTSFHASVKRKRITSYKGNSLYFSASFKFWDGLSCGTRLASCAHYNRAERGNLKIPYLSQNTVVLPFPEAFCAKKRLEILLPIGELLKFNLPAHFRPFMRASRLISRHASY